MGWLRRLLVILSMTSKIQQHSHIWRYIYGGWSVPSAIRHTQPKRKKGSNMLMLFVFIICYTTWLLYKERHTAGLNLQTNTSYEIILLFWSKVQNIIKRNVKKEEEKKHWGLTSSPITSCIWATSLEIPCMISLVLISVSKNPISCRRTALKYCVRIRWADRSPTSLQQVISVNFEI